MTLKARLIRLENLVPTSQPYLSLSAEEFDAATANLSDILKLIAVADCQRAEDFPAALENLAKQHEQRDGYESGGAQLYRALAKQAAQSVNLPEQEWGDTSPISELVADAMRLCGCPPDTEIHLMGPNAELMFQSGTK